MSEFIRSVSLNFVYRWAMYESEIWWACGAIVGMCLALAYLCRNNFLWKVWAYIGVAFAVFEFGFYFLIPHYLSAVGSKSTGLPNSRMYYGILGVAIGVISVILFIRYFSSLIDLCKHKITRVSRTERNKKTDIRSIEKHIPAARCIYDPVRYFDKKKGIFVGLDENSKPVYISSAVWQESHVSTSGTTGSGKGVASCVMLAQSIMQGEAVIVIDPKGDEFAPRVLENAAKNTGVPYIYVDLTSREAAQWNPIQNKTEQEIEEMFAAGFSMGERGTDADYYRLDDRKCAAIAGRISEKYQTLNDLLVALKTEYAEQSDAAKKFIADLEEIAMSKCTQTRIGLDIAAAIEAGAVIYVRGSVRNPRIEKLQRIFTVSVMQFIEKRERDTARQVSVFLDEFRFLISRPTLAALATIRHKRAHVLLAYQSLNDLRNCPADMDPEAVIGAVNENTAIKIAYSVRDPETAEWLSRMSGTIQVDDEIRKVKTNMGLSEIRESDRSLRQTERALIDTNMIQSLPPRCAVLFGVGLAKMFFTSPIRVEESSTAMTPITFDSSDVRQSNGRGSPSLGEGLIDVD